jgi:DNA-binding NtrC family response regulator
MSAMRAHAEKVAALDDPVLVTGESGTGKTVLCRHLHQISARRNGPLVVRGCGEFDIGTFEATLFGHTRDAYTGAATDQKGLLGEANGGTLILDDIDYVPRDYQSKLLRFLDDRKYFRVGDPNKECHANVRVMVTTNKDLTALVEQGRFLPDLYYRLWHWKVDLPPLRDRTDDVKRMADEFLLSFQKRNLRKGPTAFSNEAATLLASMKWPGNVRELRATVENIALNCEGSHPRISIEATAEAMFRSNLIPAGCGLPLLPQLERAERIHRILILTGWNIMLAARIVGVSRNTIYSAIETNRWPDPR